MDTPTSSGSRFAASVAARSVPKLDAMSSSPCWICGALADSSEHMVKASDFRAIFPGITHKNPVFRHSRESVNQRIKGVNSDDLKFSPSICQRCNNSRTQPHDLAWQELSATLQATSPLVAGRPMPIKRAFGVHAHSKMLGVHLYFLKLLGCMAVEYEIPLPTRSFAIAILSGVPHPHVRLGFSAVPLVTGPSADIYVGHVDAINRGSLTVGAAWFYVIGGAGVHVVYHEPTTPRLASYRGWHPDDVGLSIRLH